MGNENVYVKAVLDDKDAAQVLKYMNESELFHNKTDRYVGSPVSCLIYRDDEPIGFLNLVNEPVPVAVPSNYFLFLDILIDDEYRGHGYAAMAYEDFRKKYTGNQFIIAETEESNMASNKTLQKCGIQFYSYGGRNHYLMDKDRLLELQSIPLYSRLIEHMERPQVRAHQYILEIRDTQ